MTRLWFAPLLLLVACDPPPGSRAANTGTPTGEATSTVADADAATDDTVTMAEYTQLHNGMTYAEAVAIIGFPGTEDSSTDMAGISIKMYTWTNPDGMANMNAMFQGGRMTMKAQYGLK